MPSWLIAVPCWGERCVSAFTQYCLPSLFEAMKECPGEYRFLVHTDTPELIDPYLRGQHVRYRWLPQVEEAHQRLGECHREAIIHADPGEYVVPLTCDVVFSRECFKVSEEHFAAGKKLIVCAATRCLMKDDPPPIGATSRELLAWVMQNLHPAIKDLFWGTGKSDCPWCLYFRGPHGVVVRGMHLHPFAVVKHDGLMFSGVNVDAGLGAEFPHEQVHVVTRSNEMSAAELSPADRLFVLTEKPMTLKTVFKWATCHTEEHHHWYFKHRIVMEGTDEDTDDIRVCNELMEKLSYVKTSCYGKNEA